jgi:hypothetical protein
LAEHIGVGRILTNFGDRKVDQGYLRRAQVGDLAIARPEVLLIESVAPSNREDGLLPTRIFSAVYVDASHSQVRLAR